MFMRLLNQSSLLRTLSITAFFCTHWGGGEYSEKLVVRKLEFTLGTRLILPDGLPCRVLTNILYELLIYLLEYACYSVCVCVFIQGVPGEMCQTSGGCSLC
jgi:hypothetical protein